MSTLRHLRTDTRSRTGIPVTHETLDGQDVVIVINESPAESWSVRDGLPASETGVAFIKDRKPV